jgi:phosphatidate cytidylyltransferase
MALSETTTRVLVAAVGIPLAVVVIYLGSWVLAVLVGALSVVSALEFYRLAEQKSIQPLKALGAAISAIFVVVAAIDPSAGPDGAGFGTVMVLVTLVVGVVGIWSRGVAGQPLLAMSATLTGAVYTGAMLSFALFLRHLPGNEGVWHGTALVFAPIVLTWASDTSAYFVGRAFGKRKLIPAVSPGKTVEGASGALAGAVVVAVAYGYLLRQFDTYGISLLQAILLGVLISVAAQLGDLAESLLKRDAGVKDSGRLLPGHGGALDRFDSLFFTLPLGYFFFRFLLGAPQPF